MKIITLIIDGKTYDYRIVGTCSTCNISKDCCYKHIHPEGRLCAYYESPSSNNDDICRICNDECQYPNAPAHIRVQLEEKKRKELGIDCKKCSFYPPAPDKDPCEFCWGQYPYGNPVGFRNHFKPSNVGKGNEVGAGLGDVARPDVPIPAGCAPDSTGQKSSPPETLEGLNLNCPMGDIDECVAGELLVSQTKHIDELEKGWQLLGQSIKDEIDFLIKDHPNEYDEGKINTLKQVLSEMNRFKSSGDGKGGGEPAVGQVAPARCNSSTPAPETPEDYIKQITISRHGDSWEWFVENPLGGGNSGTAKSALDGLRCAVECVSGFEYVVSPAAVTGSGGKVEEGFESPLKSNPTDKHPTPTETVGDPKLEEQINTLERSLKIHVVWNIEKAERIRELENELESKISNIKFWQDEAAKHITRANNAEVQLADMREREKSGGAIQMMCANDLKSAESEIINLKDKLVESGSQINDTQEALRTAIKRLHERDNKLEEIKWLREHNTQWYEVLLQEECERTIILEASLKAKEHTYQLLYEEAKGYEKEINRLKACCKKCSGPIIIKKGGKK
jgi:hypothetical protein